MSSVSFRFQVFSREANSNLVTSCSGSVISASLVLTSPQCLLNSTTDERFSEVAVSVPTFRRPRTLRAEVANITDSWALLKIPTLSAKDLCPPNPAPKRVAQLNVRLSLLRSSLINIDVSALSKRKCWLTAFTTTTNASAFVKQDDVRMIELDTLRPSEDSTSKALRYKSAVVGNRSACWDDAGAAVMCHLNEFGDVQVGIFQTLTVDPREVADNETLHSIRECARGQSMNFAMIVNDQHLVSAIEKHDLPAFAEVYRRCRFGDD
ncbi:unnamed protein product [Toxocara canis]|uniref:Peptidase S1 domain-containing protein n=1 Tax=Toxocara canis TaxID=6265 RepID=A0A183VBP0_TOXCA|nr:unnamed protein product [Toxocara canis]